uniref:acyl-CoA dehydrogenase family protein n=1 Tax=Nocardioides sp. TaxID=35761 RepID=UPI0035164E5C
MDFTFTPEQDEAAALTARILTDRATTARMKEVEAAGDRFDRDLWRELGEAGLLTLHLPEAVNGAGLGLIELARVLVEVGRRVAPVPLAVHGAATAVLAGESGAAAEAATSWLDGERLLTVALAEERSHLPQRPTVVARAEGAGWALSGTKVLVRAGMAADAALVTATLAEEGGTAVFLLDLGAAGITRVAGRVSDGDSVARLDLEAAPAVRLDVEASRLHQVVLACSAAEQLGVTEGALALTAAYAKTREQFGRPIGTFQAVSQRLADGYIDVLAQRLTLWQAVWRLAEGLPAE